jgi:hypothetical protein
MSASAAVLAGLVLTAVASGGTPGLPGPALGARVQDTVPEETYGCIRCHADKRRAFFTGVHSERGIRCHDCHGGNPATFDEGAAHRGDYIGAPDKWQTVRLCASCHADPDRMRQFGLPTGQLAEFRTSRHGRLLLEARNPDAPTCTDCHEAHAVFRRTDARSPVHPANLPGTCARCHEDRALMAKYGLPTDQLRVYRGSAHGVALFERENFAAPTCTGCHGAHAALPPAVSEVKNVCGRCHVWVRRDFERGPHGSAQVEGRPLGCTDCHSNHGTERVPVSELAARCQRCHPEGSRAAVVGAEIQERAQEAARELAAADSAIARLVRNGEPVSDFRIRYRQALTDYLHIAHVQHSFDLERLEDLTLRVASVSRDLRAAAEASDERRWEHRLLLVPLWFLTAAAVFLAALRLGAVRERDRG